MAPSATSKRGLFIRLAVYLVLAVAITDTGMRAMTALKFVSRKPTSPTGTEAEWARYAQGPRLGPADAPLTAIVFTDYECIACSRASTVLARVRERYPMLIAEIIRQYPLPSHPRAEDAARAALCAGDRFALVHRALLTPTAAASATTWRGVARAQMGADTLRFDSCLGTAETTRRLREEIDAGERLRVSITPTILLNEARYDGLPADFEAVVLNRIRTLQGSR